MNIQIRKETKPAGIFFHAFKKDDQYDMWRFVLGSTVLAGASDDELVCVEECKANAKAQLFPVESVVVSYYLDDDGEPISPTEGI